MSQFFGKTLALRQKEPKEDLISALAHAEIDGERLDVAEAVSFCVLLLLAGNETTTSLIGNLFDLLADHPELWSSARNDRSLVDPIIEETLRHSSPVQRLMRVTTRDVEIHGVALPKDTLVDVFYGAANRDPAVFEGPDEFRLNRPRTDHLAFGQGIHFCLGAALARAEVRITLNAFLDRFSKIERASDAPRRQRFAPATYCFVSLPLLLGK